MQKSILVLIGLLSITTSVLGQGVPNYQPQRPSITAGLSIDQKLGAQLPLDTPFTDETGKQIKFGDVISNRPVLLVPIFYSCRGVCDVEMHALLKTVVKMNQTFPVGKVYDVVLLGIHPKETWDLAKAKKAFLMSDMFHPTESDKNSVRPWKMLTGSQENIRKITDAVGFHYTYDWQLDIVNHPAGSMAITPDGRVSGYFYGAEFYTKTLQQKLLLASKNEIGKPEKEIVLLGCIRLDPTTGRRTLIIENFLKIAGCSTVLILAGWIFGMSRKYRVQPIRPGGAPLA